MFNLNSTSNAKYNWLFLEPFVYLGIVYADSQGMIDSGMAKKLYLGYFAYIMVVYLMLMRNIVV